MPFINQWVIIPVSKSKSESLRTFKYEVSVFGSCLVCVVQSQAAFSYKDNKNLWRKQGVSQASVVKVGQPAELGSWSPCFVLFCCFFFSTALLGIPLVIYNINLWYNTKKKKRKKTEKPKRGRCNGTNVPYEAPPLD